jgi:hypothetical protein
MQRWAWLAVLCLGSACGDDGSSGAGTDSESSGEPGSSSSPATTEPSTSTTQAEGSSTTTEVPTGPSNCGGTCAPPIPAGWSGPVKSVTNAIDCNGGFADPAGAFFTDFDPGEDSCSCACQPMDAACADTVEVQVWGSGGCAGDPDYVANIDTNACSPFPGPFDAALDDPDAPSTLAEDFFTIGPVVIGSGTCEGTATFNEGGFGSSIQLCAPTAEPSMCEDGGPCIGDNSDVCIWQEGEHACPDGYSAAVTAYSGSDDQRECGTCDCGTPQGICDASVQLQTDACGAGVTISNDDCTNSGNIAITAATYDPGTPAISCDGGTGTAPISGTVEPIGAVTICCQE